MTLALYVLGLLLIVFGVWSIYHPAGFIVAGLLLFALSMVLDRHKDASRNDESR